MRELLITKLLAMYPQATFVVSFQQLVNGIRPGSWNDVVIGVTPKQAVNMIVDQALIQRWVHALVDALVKNSPSDPDVQRLQKWIDDGPYAPSAPHETTAAEQLQAIRSQMLLATRYDLPRLLDEVDVIQERLRASGTPAEVAEARELSRRLRAAIGHTGNFGLAPSDHPPGPGSWRWVGALTAAMASIVLVVVIWKFLPRPDDVKPLPDAGGVLPPPRDAQPAPYDAQPAPFDVAPPPIDTQPPVDVAPRRRCYFEAGAFSYAPATDSGCSARCPQASGVRESALRAEAASEHKSCAKICDCVPP